MELKVRIDKIKDFFILFQVSNEASYALVKFANNWVIPEDMYDGLVKTSKDKNGCYFFTDPEVDPDMIFDAIDEVITQNENMMKKNELFKIKINELKEMFENEELDKLSTMEFVFGENNLIKSFDKKKEQTVEKVEKKVEEEKDEVNDVPEKKQEDKKKTSKIMEVAKSMVK